MLYKSCNLIFHKDIRNEKDLIFIKNDCQCQIGDVYSNKYYVNLNNGVELSLVANIREYLSVHEDYTLKFVEINNKKFKVEKIKNIRGKNVMLDLSEEL